jgi:hypothetical protein
MGSFTGFVEALKANPMVRIPVGWIYALSPGLFAVAAFQLVLVFPRRLRDAGKRRGGSAFSQSCGDLWLIGTAAIGVILPIVVWARQSNVGGTHVKEYAVATLGMVVLSFLVAVVFGLCSARRPFWCSPPMVASLILGLFIQCSPRWKWVFVLGCFVVLVKWGTGEPSKRKHAARTDVNMFVAILSGLMLALLGLSDDDFFGRHSVGVFVGSWLAHVIALLNEPGSSRRRSGASGRTPGASRRR